MSEEKIELIRIRNKPHNCLCGKICIGDPPPELMAAPMVLHPNQKAVIEYFKANGIPYIISEPTQ